MYLVSIQEQMYLVFNSGEFKISLVPVITRETMIFVKRLVEIYIFCTNCTFDQITASFKKLFFWGGGEGYNDDCI